MVVTHPKNVNEARNGCIVAAQLEIWCKGGSRCKRVIGLHRLGTNSLGHFTDKKFLNLLNEQSGLVMIF